MAEYIDRDLAIEKTDYLVLETCYDCEKVEDMMRDIPPADVVEREKYEKALEEIEHLECIGEQNDSLNYDLANAIEKYNDLHSKINKAIEDIEAESTWGCGKFMQDNLYNRGLNKALEILKRNIGE